jgi:hypothetical protein
VSTRWGIGDSKIRTMQRGEIRHHSGVGITLRSSQVSQWGQALRRDAPPAHGDAACGRSTTFRSGHSILSGAMTFGWCVVSGSESQGYDGLAAVAALGACAGCAEETGRNEGAPPGGLRVLRQASVPVPVPVPVPVVPSTCRRAGPAEPQISFPVDTLWPETVNSCFLTPSTIAG